MFGTFAFAQTPFATAEVGIIYASSVLESAQGADVINAFANFAAQVADSGVAADTTTSSLTFKSSVSETATAPTLELVN